MKLHLIALLVLVVIISSCNRKSYSKAYVASGPHVADFSTTKQTKIKVLGSLTDLEFQLAVPIKENFGISANGLLGFTGQQIGEVGIIYYKNKNDSYLEFNAGLGYGYIDSEVKGVGTPFFHIPALSAGSYYSHTIQSNYIKLYLQSSLIYNIGERLRFGPTFKVSPILFTRYDYDYLLNDYGGSGYSGKIEHDDVSFKNKFGVNIEPVLNFRLDRKKNPNTKLILQIGGSFTTSVFKSETFQRNISQQVKIFNHPKQNNLIFNIGYEYNF